MILTLPAQSIREIFSPDALSSLENGALILLPQLHFELTSQEQTLFNYPWSEGRSKNISWDGKKQCLKADGVEPQTQILIQAMMQRYAQFATQCITHLFPSYQSYIIPGRTSFRPIEVEGRTAPSYRKDDTRLHVDAFPATPNQDYRLLRVFYNLNPQQKPRVWKIGENFSVLFAQFAERLRRPFLFKKYLLHALKLTKSVRSDYDDLMLQLHNKMKGDMDYQQRAQQQRVELPAGATWIVFTDCVSHAALAGQYCLEQTFLLPVAAMEDPARSPLKILEKHFGVGLID